MNTKNNFLNLKEKLKRLQIAREDALKSILKYKESLLDVLTNLKLKKSSGKEEPFSSYIFESDLLKLYNGKKQIIELNSKILKEKFLQEELKGTTIFAVDGSNIFLEEGFFYEIGIIKIAIFKIKRDEESNYIKESFYNFFTPLDFLDNKEIADFKDFVHFKRFEAEVGALINFMNSFNGGKETLLCLFDGSLIVTFSSRLSSELQNAYIDSILKLLEASYEKKIPLIAYIDNSRARDVVSLIEKSHNFNEEKGIYDVYLFDDILDINERSVIFKESERKILEKYKDFKDKIGFLYLKKDKFSYPSRVEFPLWMANSIDKYLKILFLDIMVGKGYPYAIETADKESHLSSDYKDFFEALIKKNLPSLSNRKRILKSESKRRRR